MDEYLNNYVNDSAEEEINYELSRSFFQRNTSSTKKKDDNTNFQKTFNECSLSVKSYNYWRGLRPVALREFRKKTSSTNDLQKEMHKSPVPSVISYNYWRGMRPDALSAFWNNIPYKNDLQKIESPSHPLKSYNYWRGLRSRVQK